MIQTDWVGSPVHAQPPPYSMWSRVALPSAEGVKELDATLDDTNVPIHCHDSPVNHWNERWRFKESSTPRRLRARPRTSSNNEVPKINGAESRSEMKIGTNSEIKIKNQATAADAVGCKERNKSFAIAYHAVAMAVSYVTEQYNVAMNHLEFPQQLSNFLIGMSRNIFCK